MISMLALTEMKKLKELKYTFSEILKVGKEIEI